MTTKRKRKPASQKDVERSRKYNKATYDRLSVYLPKDEAETWRKAADNDFDGSVSALIKFAVRKYFGG